MPSRKMNFFKSKIQEGQKHHLSYNSKHILLSLYQMNEKARFGRFNTAYIIIYQCVIKYLVGNLP